MLKSFVIRFCIVAVLLNIRISSFAQEPIVQAAPAADKPAENAPTYDPPQIVVAAAIDKDDNLVLVTFRTIFIGFTGYSYNDRSVSTTPLKDVSIFSVKGKRVSVDEARKQLAGKDTPILCSSWKTPLPAFYASLFTPETLHFIFPEQSPAWNKIQEPGRPLR